MSLKSMDVSHSRVWREVMIVSDFQLEFLFLEISSEY